MFRTVFMLQLHHYYYLLFSVMVRLPKSVQEIADVIGRENTLYLIGQLPKCPTPSRGGSEVLLYVPTLNRLTPDHRLVKILGYPLARKLSANCAGLWKPANCNSMVKSFRNRSMIQFFESGHTIAEIAEIFETTTKYTRKILQDMGYNTDHNLKRVLQNAD